MGLSFSFVFVGVPQLSAGVASQDLDVRFVAHHWPTAVYGLTHVGLSNLFVASVASPIDNIEAGELILVRYLHRKDVPPRIQELLSDDGVWRISATRDEECDRHTADLVSIESIDAESGSHVGSRPALELLPGALGIAIPKANLTCYTFGPVDFRRIDGDALAN